MDKPALLEWLDFEQARIGARLREAFHARIAELTGNPAAEPWPGAVPGLRVR